MSKITSETTFSELLKDSAIANSLAASGITQPTPVQEATIPLAEGEGKDLTVKAQTGSGKTLAFSIPLISRLHSDAPPKDKTFALVLTPTRELTEQVAQVVSDLSADCSPACIIGGVDPSKQEKALAKDSRVVVGTPGRVLDFLNQGIINLKNCRFFALDEADEMLSMGFLEDVSRILSKLPKERQGLLVSATITPRVEMLADRFLKSPQSVEIDLDEDLIPEVDHLYCETGSDLMAKPKVLCDLIEARKPNSAIIFCNTKSDTALVETYLRRRGFDARRLNSDLSQSKRQKVMKRIKDKELRFLVATDIAARGIDIEEIEYVFNFAIHEQFETYVHRTGRTGRAGKKGCAISLISPRDFGPFHHITKVLDLDFKQIEPPTTEEVVSGRLEHLETLLKDSNSNLDEKDRQLASSFLAKIDAGKSESTDLLAVILKEFLQSRLVEETESIDDELEKPEASEEKSDKRKSRKSKDDRKSGDSRRDRKESNRDDSPEPIRVFINQGEKAGINKEQIEKLISEKVDSWDGEILKLSVREDYSFLDIDSKHEAKILEGLKGVSLESGETLRLERAASLRNRRPKGRDNGRSHGRRNSGGRSSKGSRGRGRRDNGRSKEQSSNRGGNS